MELVALSGRFPQEIHFQASLVRKSPGQKRRGAAVGAEADGRRITGRLSNATTYMIR
jgi:hypothetical protein